MQAWKKKLHDVIYEAETPAGKLFDVVLLWAILFSVLFVVLESVADIEVHYGSLLRRGEWFFTILFTIEYVLRILAIRRPLSYVFSFFGIIDLLSILPTYLSLYFAGTQGFAVIRAVRLLRVFRVLKLVRFLGEAAVLYNGLRASLPKITVFLGGVAVLAVVAGSTMFLIEGQENGFTSIPKGIYWAVVTMTTVGYGDLIPQTVMGQMFASLLMIMGYGIIAVPAGIVTVSVAKASQQHIGFHSDTTTCYHCSNEKLGFDSNFCRFCGTKLERK